MTSRQCNHIWKQFGYEVRTDKPGQKVMQYECTICNALYRG